MATRLIGLQRGESMPLRVATMIPHPSQLDVLASFPGEQDQERRLHDHFVERRIDGEWFYLGSATTAVQRVEEAYALTPSTKAPLATIVRARPGIQSITPAAIVAEEPLSPLGQSAARHHELFRAWTDAGFSEDQALRLLALTLQVGGWSASG